MWALCEEEEKKEREQAVSYSRLCKSSLIHSCAKKKTSLHFWHCQHIKTTSCISSWASIYIIQGASRSQRHWHNDNIASVLRSPILSFTSGNALTHFKFRNKKRSASSLSVYVLNFIAYFIKLSEWLWTRSLFCVAHERVQTFDRSLPPQSWPKFCHMSYVTKLNQLN